jgi:hypothetical protein
VDDMLSYFRTTSVVDDFAIDATDISAAKALGCCARDCTAASWR